MYARAVSGAPEIIFISSDVVFAKIIPRLYLYEDEICTARILYAVHVAARDIDCLSRFEADLFPVVRENGIALDNEPVLSPSLMALQAQAFAGIHRDPLDLVIIGIDEVFVKTPWPVRIIIVQSRLPNIH